MTVKKMRRLFHCCSSDSTLSVLVLRIEISVKTTYDYKMLFQFLCLSEPQLRAATLCQGGGTDTWLTSTLGRLKFSLTSHNE